MVKGDPRRGRSTTDPIDVENGTNKLIHTYTHTHTHTHVKRERVLIRISDRKNGLRGYLRGGAGCTNSMFSSTQPHQEDKVPPSLKSGALSCFVQAYARSLA